MKGPSLDAIRRFKSEQELKKKEDEEKKIKEKMAILEHRAAQGDRKAKIDLKKFKDAIEKPPPDPKTHVTSSLPLSKHSNKAPNKPPVAAQACKKQKPPADFEELMKIAKQNATAGPKPIAKPQQQPPPPPPPQPAPALPVRTGMVARKVIKKPEPGRIKTPAPISNRAPPRNPNVSQPTRPAITSQASRPSTNQQVSRSFPAHRAHRPIPANQVARGFHPSHAPRYRRDDYYDDEDEDEDEYESDGFVVDEEDDDIQSELRNTIRSVFNYDKRRCDLREMELDREYRAIGPVSTFEDLEREERRASRMAAVEDAKELRLEEERKRAKLAKKAGKTR